MKKIILILVLLLVSLFFIKKTDILPFQPHQTTPPSINKPTMDVQIPDGWKQYTDSKFGINFAVPADYKIEQNGDYSVLAIPPNNENYPAGNARFFYVSLVPNNLKNDDSGQIYNYSASFHQKLLAIPVGEIKNLSELQGQKDWFYYERSGDDVFNGRSAKVFVNQRPWEFPNGTWEYRYIFELKDKTVITGAYIEGGPSDAPFTLPLLQQIMGTLVLNE